jgi:hypothetical protein
MLPKVVGVLPISARILALFRLLNTFPRYDAFQEAHTSADA